MGVNGGPNGPAAGNQDTGWTGFREGKNFPPPADMAVPGAYNWPIWPYGLLEPGL